MKTYILTSIFMALSFTSLFGTTPEQKFWTWFEKNEARLFTFEKDQEATFDDLGNALHAVHKSLTFEFGPIQDGKREFVISADGIKEAFPKVRSLYGSAPNLRRWTWIAFRPRRVPMDIEYLGLKVVATDVRVLIGKPKEGDRIPLMVLFPGYLPSEEKKYKGIAFLLLDGALGEYDVETHIGYIGAGGLDHPSIDHAYTLNELSKRIDELKK
jgi:hypothetical protein